MQKFNLLQDIEQRATVSHIYAVIVDYLNNCTAEQRERARLLSGCRQNVGMIIEATLNPDGRQNAQGKGEPSHGDFIIEWNGKRYPCECKALCKKTTASDAENGTTAPLTLLFFYDLGGYSARLGRSENVKISTKCGKRVIKYQDNFETFGEVVNIHNLKTFALHR